MHKRMIEHLRKESLVDLWVHQNGLLWNRVQTCLILQIAIITAWGRAYQQKWLRKDEWQYWIYLVQDISASPSFRWTLEWMAEARQYNERFLKDLMEIVHSRRPVT
jgi:hypothetical protein